MKSLKTKAIENLEARMENIGPDSMRREVLESAKSFKESWIRLGQALYSVWKDKLYKDWGFTEFDTYTRKEIGIRKDTALKLLRSYYFLEKEEPDYLKNSYRKMKNTASLPSYEAIDALRLASKKKLLDSEDYADIKKKVLYDGKDVREIKRDLTQLIKRREELEPDEARQKRRQALLKRFIGTLRSIKNELKASKLLSAQVLSDTDKLLSRLESELS